MMSKRTFQAITDKFERLDQVQAALRTGGLESSQLIIAVDYTKSNEWTGKESFQGRCLHDLSSGGLNPYEHVMSIMARTLAAFDDDGLISAIGFGDTNTQDHSVFSFLPGNEPARGIEALQHRYRELTPQTKLSGPTSFAPAIYEAMKITAASGGQFHILILIADGQVTRPSDMPRGHLSRQEEATVKAIVAASNLPLSIVMVGVGDGPWDVMKEFDDQLPTRKWDNFQFVNFTSILSRYRHDPSKLEARFAVDALMEIPEQFKIIQKMGLLGRKVSLQTNVRCLEPPMLHPPPQPAGGAGPSPGYPLGPSPSFNHASSFNRAYPGVGAQASAPSSYPVPPPYPSWPTNPGGPPQGGLPPGASYGIAVTDPAQANTGMPYGSGFGGMAGAPAGPPQSRSPSTCVVTVNGEELRVDNLFICPITQDIMKDPVMAADGFTYDRESIAMWLQSHETSPMTNAKFDHKNLTPNHALRSSILEFLQQNKR